MLNTTNQPDATDRLQAFTEALRRPARTLESAIKSAGARATVLAVPGETKVRGRKLQTRHFLVLLGGNKGAAYRVPETSFLDVLAGVLGAHGHDAVVAALAMYGESTARNTCKVAVGHA